MKQQDLKKIILQLQYTLSLTYNDLKKALKGNQSAAQRARVGTIEIARVAKEYRRLSNVQGAMKQLKKDKKC